MTTSSNISLAPAIRALADPTRMRILLMLEEEKRTVGQIVEFFKLSQPTISRHLQRLLSAGLVKRDRQGQHVYYAINAGTVQQLCIGLADCFPCRCISVTASKEQMNTDTMSARRRRPSQKPFLQPKGGAQ